MPLVLGMGGFSYARIASNGQICSSAINILAQNKRKITCAANIFTNLGTFQCNCGQSF